MFLGVNRSLLSSTAECAALRNSSEFMLARRESAKDLRAGDTTAFCKTLGGSARLAACPQIFAGTTAKCKQEVKSSYRLRSSYCSFLIGLDLKLFTSGIAQAYRGFSHHIRRLYYYRYKST